MGLPGTDWRVTRAKDADAMEAITRAIVKRIVRRMKSAESERAVELDCRF